MTDPSDRHERIRAVFSAVFDLPPMERSAYLENACADDAALRAEVEELLSHHDAADAPLADEDAGLAMDIVSQRDAGAALPERIGPYRIERLLGRGGMGVVYLAQQAEPKRTVALKIMRPGVVQDETRARFKREVRLLGKLQHPGIAHIYEAGTAEVNGAECAYFAMEYVAGRTLTDYVQQEELSSRDRLALLADICDAVQHAHEQGIVHRDLKPGNILVDKSGRPRVLDFGVARATHSDAQTLTLETNVGQIVGTLQYMSPEQISGRTDAVDARSDVYAIGVIAFELLTGRLPYAVKDQTLVQVARTIQETEPTRIGLLDTRLRGDVETILGKALEKDRARRYATVADLAADIRAYLRNEPIHARPASTFYQFRKFAQRNRALVAGVSIAMLALLVGVIVSTALYLQADEARARAEREATRVAAINAFLVDDMLAASNPWETGGRDVTVASVLDFAAAGVGERFANEPAVECSIRGALGEAYRALGLFEDAAPQYEQALALARDAAAQDDALLLKLSEGRAENYKELGDFDAAEKQVRTALAIAEANAADAPAVAGVLETLAGIQMGQGQYEQAEATLRRAVQMLEQNEDAAVARARITNSLGSALYLQTRFDEAMALKQQALQTLKDELGPEHPLVAQTLNDIGNTYWEQDDYERAEPYLREALAILEKKLGPHHSTVLLTRRSLANNLSFIGRNDEAEPMLVEVIATSEKTLGPAHPETMAAVNSLATLYLRTQRPADALPLFQRLLSDADRTLGANHPETLKYAANLAWCDVQLGELVTAETQFRRAADGFETTLGLAHADTQSTYSALAQLYKRQQQFQKEVDSLKKVLDGCAAAGVPEDLDFALYLHRYGSALMMVEDYAGACAPLRRCIEICNAGFPPNDWRTALAQSKLGECLSRVGEYDAAEATLKACIAANDVSPQPKENPRISRERLRDHYRRSGQTQLADALDAELQTSASTD